MLSEKVGLRMQPVDWRRKELELKHTRARLDGHTVGRC